MNTACRNVKPNEKNASSYYQLDCFIVPACPEEPGRVVVQKSERVWWSKNDVKERQNAIVKPLLGNVSSFTAVKKMTPTADIGDKKFLSDKPTEKAHSKISPKEKQRRKSNPPKKLSIVNDKSKKAQQQSSKPLQKPSDEKKATKDETKKLIDTKKEINSSRPSPKKCQESLEVLAKNPPETEQKTKQPAINEASTSINQTDENELEKCHINEKQKETDKKSEGKVR